MRTIKPKTFNIRINSNTSIKYETNVSFDDGKMDRMSSYNGDPYIKFTLYRKRIKWDIFDIASLLFLDFNDSIKIETNKIWYRYDRKDECWYLEFGYNTYINMKPNFNEKRKCVPEKTVKAVSYPNMEFIFNEDKEALSVVFQTLRATESYSESEYWKTEHVDTTSKLSPIEKKKYKEINKTINAQLNELSRSGILKEIFSYQQLKSNK